MNKGTLKKEFRKTVLGLKPTAAREPHLHNAGKGGEKHSEGSKRKSKIYCRKNQIHEKNMQQRTGKGKEEWGV